jgi:hypothetical protein
MTTRAADDFDAIRARMDDLAGKPRQAIKPGEPSQKLMHDGLLTVNEARAAEGLQPIDRHCVCAVPISAIPTAPKPAASLDPTGPAPGKSFRRRPA